MVTDARPEEVRKLFRNARLIGRRFRLAHVRFGREIIEVATFRAIPREARAREGRTAEVEAYCRDDVALLRDLLRHAEQRGYLCFRSRNGERLRIPAAWSLPELVERERARAERTARGYALGSTQPPEPAAR